ncbi:MAG: hypothetical protein Q8Q31_03225 [Nanoarchaeota archaeon]|nr:hypothetical protein [Nanoarchaeota archaeon]
MGKIILNHHASTVLVKCDNTGEFLFGKYDPGYPGKNRHWIGRVKVLGGNYFAGKDSDVSPLETVRREIGEEFSGKKAAEGEMAALQQHNFAKPSDIRRVREALLDMEPFQDYLLHHPGPEDKPQIYVIQSVYRVNVPRKVMELVKENLSQGRSITNEGLLAVHTLQDIQQGRPMAQGITGLVMGHAEGISVPHCFQDAFTFAPIGKPRNAYLMYTDNFEYRNHPKK